MVVNQILWLWALLFAFSTIIAVILLILSVRLISKQHKTSVASKQKVGKRA